MAGAPPMPPPPPSGGPAGPSPGPILCPSCRAPVSTTDKFCPACGALISPPKSAPAAGNAPVDIRQRVDEDRGVLKRLQLLVPGYRGYRQGEDLREADSVLRLQVADKIHGASAALTQRRQSLATAGRFDGLTDLATALADLARLEGEIRHAEQGYTGISPALRVSPAGQDQLYEYDYGFALAADDLARAAAGLADPSADPATVAAGIANLRGLVTRLEQAFRARIQVIQKVRVP